MDPLPYTLIIPATIVLGILCKLVLWCFEEADWYKCMVKCRRARLQKEILQNLGITDYSSLSEYIRSHQGTSYRELDSLARRVTGLENETIQLRAVVAHTKTKVRKQK